MLIVETNIDVVNATKAFLNSCFEMKDLGEADVILGIKITRTSYAYGLSLYLFHYIEKIFKKFNQFGFTPSKTPYNYILVLVWERIKVIVLDLIMHMSLVDWADILITLIVIIEKFWLDY